MNENTSWDAIVVGARCAGAPLAMLLARRGHRVLLVDRATFPSDTLSTHFIHPAGMECLARWGLSEALVASGCPPIGRYRFDFGPLVLEGAPGRTAADLAYCPRRTVLDEQLVSAAVRGGAEVREGFTVDGLVFEAGRVVGLRGHGRGGAEVIERARVVVGADGRHSVVAREVRPERYRETPPLQAGYYTYFSGLPCEAFEIFSREGCGFAAAPTHHGLTMVVAGWRYAEFEARRKDPEASFYATLAHAPAMLERVRAARREAKFGGAATPNFFARPFGPGWALAGDAGYLKDPITAQGMTDAFLDAQRLADALDQSFSGARPHDEAMEAAWRARDARALPLFEQTCQAAAMEPPPAQVVELLRAVSRSQESMDAFVQMNSGTLSPAEFFAPQNVARLLAQAA